MFFRRQDVFLLYKKDLALRGILKIRNSFFLMTDLKNKGGRPRLTEGKRCKPINIRFTEAEYQQIDALEKALGINKTELVRIRVLHNADLTVVNSQELIKYLDAIGAELGRAGNNINQLARHANVMKLKGDLPPVTAEKFNHLMEAYINMQSSLETALRKIIRLMSK